MLRVICSLRKCDGDLARVRTTVRLGYGSELGLGFGFMLEIGKLRMCNFEIVQHILQRRVLF